MKCADCKHWTQNAWQHKTGAWTSYGIFDGEIKGKCKWFDEPKLESESCADYQASDELKQAELFL